MVFPFQNTVSAEEIQNTKENYTSYLTGLIDSGDSGAATVLDQFNNLAPEQQEAFVEFLYSPEYGSTVSNAIEQEENGVRTKNVVVDDIILPVTISKFETITDANSQQLLAVPGVITLHSEAEIGIAGITTSRLITDMKWEHDGSVATKNLTIGQGHNNWNPAYFITEQGTNNPGYITGGYAYGWAKWKMSSTGTAGALSSTWTVDIKGSNVNHVYRKLTTDKINGNGYDWTQIQPN